MQKPSAWFLGPRFSPTTAESKPYFRLEKPRTLNAFGGLRVLEVSDLEGLRFSGFRVLRVLEGKQARHSVQRLERCKQIIQAQQRGFPSSPLRSLGLFAQPIRHKATCCSAHAGTYGCRHHSDGRKHRRNSPSCTPLRSPPCLTLTTPQNPKPPERSEDRRKNRFSFRMAAAFMSRSPACAA